MVFCLIAGVACTRATQVKTTIKLSLPELKSKAASQSLSSVSSTPTIRRIMLNITGPGIAAPIVWIWQASNQTDLPPGSITLDVPKGTERLLQALLVTETPSSNLTTPYNCSSQDSDSSNQSFYYGDSLVELTTADQAVALTVSALGISQGLEGRVSGRYLPTAGVNRGPSGKLVLKAALPGKPAMVVDETEAFDGWFSAYALEGLPFQYVIEGQDVFGQSLDLANAGGYLTAAGIPASRAYVVQTATGWSPRGFNPYCGGRKVAAKKILVGAFGPGASQMTVCAPAASTLSLFSSYTYSSSVFTFSSPASWSVSSTVPTDARVIAPAGGSGVAVTGTGACATGTDLVDRWSFSSSQTGGSGGDDLLPVHGPFSFVSGGLSATPSSTGYSLSWNYVPNMSSVLASADVFVRSGVYASGSATSSSGGADFQDSNDGYKCSSLTSLGFQLAGSAGKDSAGNLATTFTITGLNSSDMAANKVQVVVCPKTLAGAYTKTGLACGDRSACGAVSSPTLSLSQSMVTVSSSTIASGSTAVVTLMVKDSSGGLITGGGFSVAFQTVGGTSSGTFSLVTDNGNGSYSSTFTGTSAGTPTQIAATINGQAVTSTLPTVTVTASAPAISAAMSTISVSKSDLPIGQSAWIILQAKDSSGNPISSGGATVLFSASGGSSTLSIGAVTDYGNGTYKAVVTGTGLGTAQTIQGSINGVSVTSTPPTITVITPVHRAAYVANPSSNAIAMFSIDMATGVLTSLSQASIATGSTPVSVLTHSSGRFAYVANTASNNISMYAINADTSELKPLSPATIATGSGPVSLALDPSGRFLYSVNSSASTISMFAIDQTTGGLSSISSAVSTLGTSPMAIAIEPTGRFAYVVNSASNNIVRFAINSGTGALTSSTTASTGLAPKRLAIDPTGRLLYVANSSGNTVSMFAINSSTGNLSALSPATISTGTSPADITVDLTGRFVYVANTAAGSVSMYSINQSTGVLTSIATAVTSGAGTQSLSLDPSGRFLYAGNASADTVTQFAINPVSGALTAVNSIPAVGSGTAAIATTAGPARYAYVTSLASALVSMFSIDPLTGILAALPNPTVASGSYSRSIAVDPSGRFAYVANEVSNVVNMYSLDHATGQLNPLSPASIAAGSGGSSVAIDPTGRFVYVANLNSNDVSMYSIDSSTGLLTSLGTIAAASQPYSVAVDKTGRFAYVASYSGSVNMYAIDANTGALSALGTPTIASDSASKYIALSPSGRFAYVTTRVNTIRIFNVDISTGVLSDAATPSVAAHDDPYAIAIDPSGRYAYYCARNQPNPAYIGMFSINPITGSLTALTPASIATENSSGFDSTEHVGVDPTGRFAYGVNYDGQSVSMFAIDPMTGQLTSTGRIGLPSLGTSITTTR
jgi:6-phosphogluconolactonase (cycloisomerase 2 family)